MSLDDDSDFDDEMREFMHAAMDEEQYFPHNLFVNVLAGDGVIFQYDHPYESDDDDYDYFEDEDDFFHDDFEEDNCRKIFVTLQDSHIIKRLSFHKKTPGHFRFPHYLPNREECYEDMYRLLEELELMVRVWRRRSEHPYTAHLRPEARSEACGPPGSGEKLVEGEDYNQSDYEYDGSEDDESNLYTRVSTPNEVLTKKKFCQSVKIYQSIFDSSKQFDTFQRTVVRMRKYVFGVTFQIFMDTLPPDTAASLPQELWEKIWKYTQNDYFSYMGSVPLEEDKNYYKAGQRIPKSSKGLWRAEQERIGELFGAIGNLHISLFEILFKNPFNMQEYHHVVEEWESGCTEGNALKVTRSLWWKHFSIVCQKYSRLRQLDSYTNPPEDGFSPTKELSLFQKVEKGIYTIRDVVTDLEIEKNTDLMTFKAGNILVSMEHCSLFVLIGHEMNKENEDYFLTLRVCDSVTGKVVHKIHTGLKYSLFQLELGKFAMRRLGKTGWRRNFCLTQERISLCFCDNGSKSSSIKIWTCEFSQGLAETETQVVEMIEPLVDEVVAEVEEEQKSQSDNKSTIFHTKDKIVVCFQNPFRKQSVLKVYDVLSRELVLDLDWPGEELALVGCKQSRALLVNRSSNAILFFSIDSGETILNIPFSDLNDGSQVYGSWTGLFDSGPNVNEFALIRSDNSKFQLYNFEPEKEMARPSLAFSGSINDTYKLSPDCFSTAKLKEGTLFFNRRTHIASENGLDELDCYHEVNALSLRTQSCIPLLTMGSNSNILEATKFNELSLKHFDPKLKFNDIEYSTFVETFDPQKRPLFFIDSTTFGILMELGTVVKIFNFDHDERSVLGEEEQANEVIEKKREAEAARRLRAKQEQDARSREKRVKLMRAKKELEEKFVNTEVAVKGKVDEWKTTYGFIRSRGPAKKLGRIFFHRSDVPGHERRRFFRRGTELEYNLVPGRDPGTYQAVNVSILLPEKN